MKNIISVLFIIILLSAVFSCGTELPEDIAAFLLFDGVTFDADSEVLNFGTREVGGAGSAVSGTVQNLGESSITITALTLDDTDNYTLTPFTLPYELAAGAEADFTLAFAPLSTGTKTAALDVAISAGDVEETVTVDITGAGNEAPEAVFGIDVSGAVAYPEVNGFYHRDGDYGSAPKYNKSGTIDYYIYFYTPEGWYWGINDSFDTTYPEYIESRIGARCFIGSVSELYPSHYPPEVVNENEAFWRENSEFGEQITVKTGITREGGTLKSNHHYSDEEGDAETGTTYRWFQSATVDGTYTELTEETGSEYVIAFGDDDDTFFKLEVTPVDANGFIGEPATSDPYYVEPEMIMD